MEWALIFSIRNGRIFEVEYFWDYAEALEAAGLSE
jgi:ketosteroid isomerase-like protein